MTQDEFNRWFQDFCGAYPSTAEFVTKADKSGTSTLKHWFAVLERVTLTDALEVTRRMMSGDMPEVDQFNRASTPRHVARLCAELHPVVPEWKREAEKAEHEKGMFGGDGACLAAYKKAMRILDDGGTMDDVIAFLKVEFKATAEECTNYDASFADWNKGVEF